MQHLRYVAISGILAKSQILKFYYDNVQERTRVSSESTHEPCVCVSQSYIY